MEEADLKPEFIEKIKLAYDCFNKSGNGLDAMDAADALRALDLVPSNKQLMELTGAKARDEKIITVEELIKLYIEVKNNPDIWGSDDFHQLFSLYDKNMNGKMMIDDLKYYLRAIGEPLEQEQVDRFVKECIKEKIDSDGFFSYQPLLRRLGGYAPSWVGAYIAEKKAAAEKAKEEAAAAVTEEGGGQGEVKASEKPPEKVEEAPSPAEAPAS